jgi:aminoglycoside phosphotransferase (APT) family kinase protein
MDEETVRSLLAAQHPDLSDLLLVQVDAGWDNTLWRLGDEFLVRLPRREQAAPLTVNEQRWLPLLAPLLPLPVSVPIRIGRPQGPYPWAWSVLPWLAGTPADRSPVTEPADAAERLGRFLRSLHQAAPSDAPHNPFRGVALNQRAEIFEFYMAMVRAEVDTDATRRVWDRALAVDPWWAPAVWLHGDLHPANVLVDGGTLAAVIDFGDMCAGDPATDVAGAWMLLPASAIEGFNAAYGGVDATLESRSLGWAALFALMLLEIGLRERPTYESVGRSTLAKVIERSDAAGA